MRAVIWTAVSTKPQADDDRASLPEQERVSREVCDREGWRVIDVLTVPGHSRAFTDIHECARAMQQKGCNAFYDLMRHWEDCDFDVLVVRDSSRFARSQAMHAYVVEHTIHDLGLKIYSVADGTLIDDTNFRMFIAMGGYMAASENDQRTARRIATLNTYVDRGLPTGARVIWTHRKVRNPDTGKIIGIEPKSEFRQFFLDAADLLLGGMSFYKLPDELHRLHGYTASSNFPLNGDALWRAFNHPTFWGHNAHNVGFNRKLRFDAKITDLWMLEPDSGTQPPPGAKIAYNTHEPMLTGDIAEAVKAEIKRRHRVTRGKARPSGTYAFTGLVVCGCCGYTMVKATGGSGKFYLGCATPSLPNRNTRECANRRRLRDDYVRKQVDKLLREVLSGVTVFQPIAEIPFSQITLLENDLSHVESEISRLIARQATADHSLGDLYARQIEPLAERRKHLQRRITEVELTAHQQKASETRRAAALRELEPMLSQFWTFDDVQINQHLHRIFQNYRLVALDGQITRLATR